MTGADRALISSLEGFEDLQLIGRLQLHDRGIKPGDVVVCVTEGGETSSVIGTIRAALDDRKAAAGVRPGREPGKRYFSFTTTRTTGSGRSSGAGSSWTNPGSRKST